MYISHLVGIGVERIFFFPFIAFWRTSNCEGIADDEDGGGGFITRRRGGSRHFCMKTLNIITGRLDAGEKRGKLDIEMGI